MFIKTLVIALITLMVAGCAGGRFGVAPNGRMYGEVAVGPAGMRGYNHGQQQIMIQQKQTVIMQQQGYRQPRFCANYHSNSSGCYGGTGGGRQQLVQQCKVHRATGQRICRMVPPYMLNQW